MANDIILEEPPPKPASRGEQRRRAFLDAAADVFLEQGYEAASVNEVVRRASGSLATLYAQFGNKDGLFWAMVEEATLNFAEVLKCETRRDRPLEEGLQAIGEQYLTRMLMPRSLALFRIMIGEAQKFPDMAARFFMLGPDQVRQTVAEYLAARAEVEGLDFNKFDPELDGAFFCEMIRARNHYRALCDQSYAMSEEEVRRHVTATVHRFLDGLRAR